MAFQRIVYRRSPRIPEIFQILILLVGAVIGFQLLAMAMLEEAGLVSSKALEIRKRNSTTRTPTIEAIHAQHPANRQCRMMTSPWGEHIIGGKTRSNMADWTFKKKIMCGVFSTKTEDHRRNKLNLDCSLFEINPEKSKPEILTTVTDEPDDIFQVPFGNTCLESFIDNCCIDENPVPNVVHYVWYTDKELGYFHFLSLMSVIRFMKPCLIMIHGPYVPYGEYWDYFVRMSPNVIHVVRDRPTHVFGNELRYREHGSDVMRIEALIKYGGIYLDFDEILLREIDSLRRFHYTQAHELPKTMGSQLVIAKKNATFLHLWYQSYKDDYRESWAYNALWVPNTIAKNNPDLIHVEGFNFTRPNWQNTADIFERNYDWSTNYAMHMYGRWYKAPVNPTIIRTLNTTVGSVSRHVILGNKELCFV